MGSHLVVEVLVLLVGLSEFSLSVSNDGAQRVCDTKQLAFHHRQHLLGVVVVLEGLVRLYLHEVLVVQCLDILGIAVGELHDLVVGSHNLLTVGSGLAVLQLHHGVAQLSLLLSSCCLVSVGCQSDVLTEDVGLEVADELLELTQLLLGLVEHLRSVAGSGIVGDVGTSVGDVLLALGHESVEILDKLQLSLEGVAVLGSACIGLVDVCLHVGHSIEERFLTALGVFHILVGCALQAHLVLVALLGVGQCVGLSLGHYFLQGVELGHVVRELLLVSGECLVEVGLEVGVVVLVDREAGSVRIDTREGTVLSGPVDLGVFDGVVECLVGSFDAGDDTVVGVVVESQLEL